MKYLIAGVGIAVAIGFLTSFAPVEAQGSVADRCRAIHSLDPKVPASEAQRKAAQGRIAACIKSGGKS